MKSAKPIQDFLKTLAVCFKHYTVEELSTIVRGILSNKDKKNKDIEIIITLVCKKYKLPRNTLLSGKHARNLTYPKYMLCCLLHNELGLSYRYISKTILKGSETIVVSRSMKYYRSLNLKLPLDREFRITYDDIRQQLVIDTEKLNELAS